MTRIPNNNRKINRISHIRSYAGSECRSDVFRKLCSENKIRFTTAASKHQEQNGSAERHWGAIMELTNTTIIHARLSKKSFYYAVKYAQFLHDIMRVKDQLDEATFKKYKISDSGKKIKNKYNVTRNKRNFCWFPRRLFRLAFLCTTYQKNIYIFG